MDFSLFIFILALRTSALVHFSFSALFYLCLRKLVLRGYFISDQGDTQLKATSEDVVNNMSIGIDNVNTFN